MQNISFMLTIPQFKDGSKTVTRRDGWLYLRAGEMLCAVEKSQGIKKGEVLKRMGAIRIKSVTREPLRRMTDEPDYGREECRREGFPNLTSAEFVAMFCSTHKSVSPETIITRIEFEKIADHG